MPEPIPGLSNSKTFTLNWMVLRGDLKTHCIM
jgi:hypothetical protein